MSGEAFCEKHGPYDASFGRCPYCSREQGLPAAPPPLDDDLPTDPWGGREPRAGGNAPQWEDDDEITQPPMRQRAAREDEGDDEVTDLPRRRRGSREEEDFDETVVDRVETGLLGFLIVKDGARRGQVHRLGHGATVGRGEAKILIRDGKISRTHAKFTVEDDQFYVWDFGSENGTFVNGKRIREATGLQENDVIRLGDTTFVFKILE